MQYRLEQIQRMLLFFTILFLPFGAIPKQITIQSFGTILSRYTLYIGIIFFVIELIVYPIHRNRKFLFFFIFVYITALISLGLGVAYYPYRQLQYFHVYKLEKFLEIVPINISYDNLLPWWIFFRGIKNVTLDLVIYFLFPYQVYCLFKGNKLDGFNFIKKAFIVLAIFMGLYSLMEIPYLLFNAGISKKLLMLTTPWFTDVSGGYNWWPPLIRKGQLRSLCPEPPHFGIIAAICEAFLMYEYINNKIWAKKGILSIMLFYFTLMIFLSKARTALGLFLGEGALFFIYLLFQTQKKEYIKSFIKLCIIVGLSFLCTLLPAYMAGNRGNLAKEYAKEYIENNIASVKESNARSNGTRLVMAKSCWQVGINHPVWGVGKDLKDVYILPYAQFYGHNDPEIKLWLEGYSKNGPLKSPFPTTNQFLLIFSEYGAVGVFFFLCPMALCGWKLWKNKKQLHDIKIATIFIILSGQVVAMFSAVGWITYPLFLGLLFSEFEDE